MTPVSLPDPEGQRSVGVSDRQGSTPASIGTTRHSAGGQGIDHVLRVRSRAQLHSGATVSVVIPNYNYARYLPSAVRSCLSQSDVSVDVIIVDDASTDDSAVVARQLANKDGRVRVIIHQKNAGPVDTFNDGLAEARGEFVVRLDADDLLTPGSLARSVAVAQHFPSVGLVYGHPLHFSGDVLQPARANATKWTIWPGRTWLADRCRDGFNVITSPEVLMRKSLVDIVGGQRQLAHTHDMEMWFRLSAFADVAYIHGADQAWHRDHADSLSARKVDRIRDLNERRDAFNTLFDGQAGELAEADGLRRSSMRAIATHALEEAISAHSRGGENRDLAMRYVAVAQTAIADVDTLAEWRDVQKWMTMAPRSVALHPAFVARRVYRRLRSTKAWWRWHRNGVF